MKTKEIYNAIMNKFGLRYQYRKLQEECSELVAAINHNLIEKKNGIDHLHEEFADVEIMMEQIKPYLNQEMLSEKREGKLKRLKEKIETKPKAKKG